MGRYPLPLLPQLALDAASNLEKAQAALEDLRKQEAALLDRMQRVQASQLLTVQKKKELAKLAEQLQVRNLCPKMAEMRSGHLSRER